MTKEINRLRELAGINRDDKFILNEIFDNPYPYNLLYQTDSLCKFEFKTVDRDNIMVTFEMDYNVNEMIIVKFIRDGEFEITGQRDQFRIFATVLTIMKDFMENNKNIKKLCFTSKEKTRISLYRRMLSHFANKNGFEFEESKSIGSSLIKFTLSRKE